MKNQEYTITQLVTSYTFNAFTTEPPNCPLMYSYSLSDFAIDGLVSFDNELTFKFGKSMEISLAGQEFQIYVITV